MPQFLRISPTHIPGKKEYAWNNFRSRGYIAIGWLHDIDLTGKSTDDVIPMIRSEKYDNEASAIDSFSKLLSLEVGDYVAVNNVNHGLFGIGVISSGYQFQKYKHDNGSDDREDFYSHFRSVEWKTTKYVKQKEILRHGEKSWKPYGTVGKLEDEVPPYIMRLLGEKP